MSGGGYDRRDDERRGGVGGYERRDDDRRGDYDRRGGGSMGGGFDRRDDERRGFGGGGGGGTSMGSSRFSRDDRSEGYQRRYETASPESRQTAPVKDSLGTKAGGSPTESSPPSSLSKMSIKEELKDTKPAPSPTPPTVETEPKVEPEPELEPKEDPEEMARASAAEAVASGKRGKELKELIMAQEKRTTAGALLEAALADIATPQDMKWVKDDEYGPALTALSSDSTEQQVGMIYAAVGKCHNLGFPKDAKGNGIVQAIFMGMYDNDLCEEDAFLEWKVSI